MLDRLRAQWIGNVLLSYWPSYRWACILRNLALLSNRTMLRSDGYWPYWTRQENWRFGAYDYQSWSLEKSTGVASNNLQSKSYLACRRSEWTEPCQGQFTDINNNQSAVRSRKDRKKANIDKVSLIMMEWTLYNLKCLRFHKKTWEWSLDHTGHTRWCITESRTHVITRIQGVPGVLCYSRWSPGRKKNLWYTETWQFMLSYGQRWIHQSRWLSVLRSKGYESLSSEAATSTSSRWTTRASGNENSAPVAKHEIRQLARNCSDKPIHEADKSNTNRKSNTDRPGDWICWPLGYPTRRIKPT